MEINCKQTGYRAIINFKPYSWSNKELNKVDGFIYDKKYLFSYTFMFSQLLTELIFYK
jgi:hypothetical protein